ncbi:hypothetical protein [Shouchella patagoniensis]|uniref:hypothetical protein n=1 Tax=Shouchella patagoniensis TaxID=228576 RepID=UPI0009952FA2|nr:hypothetical protein [Shouchella patagoniensis]
MLNYEEEIELRYFQLSGFKWLVRNEIGSSEAFKKKPVRNKGTGYSTWVERAYPMTQEEMRRRQATKYGQYTFLTWDDEPIEINSLLDGKSVCEFD